VFDKLISDITGENSPILPDDEKLSALPYLSESELWIKGPNWVVFFIL